MHITDGSSNRTLTIDSNNRARTFSDTRDHIAAHSERGEAYSFGCPVLTVNATGGRMIWFKNLNAEYNFIVSRAFFYWNGGSTNHNRVAIASLYSGDGAPSANHTESQPGNLNLGTTKSSISEFYYWDGSNNGMTVTSGSPIGFLLLGQGQTEFDVSGSFILPYNTSVSVNIQGEEAGLFSCVVSGFYCPCSS